MAFKFYDYDSNGSIGSVDILNFSKHLNNRKMDDLYKVYTKIKEQKQEIIKAKKSGRILAEEFGTLIKPD